MLAKPSHMRRCSHRWLDETISVPPNLCQSIATPPGPLAPHPIMSDFIASLELDIVQDPPLPNPVRTVPGFPPVGALAGLAPPAITRSFADWFPCSARRKPPVKLAKLALETRASAKARHGAVPRACVPERRNRMANRMSTR